MSSFSTNLAYIAKISAKLESAKSAKNDMTDQQQNFNNITDSFNMSDLLALFNEASFNEVSFSKASLNEVSSSNNKAAELSALYQCLNCSHVNI